MRILPSEKVLLANAEVCSLVSPSAFSLGFRLGAEHAHSELGGSENYLFLHQRLVSGLD